MSWVELNHEQARALDVLLRDPEYHHLERRDQLNGCHWVPPELEADLREWSVPGEYTLADILTRLAEDNERFPEEWPDFYLRGIK